MKLGLKVHAVLQAELIKAPDCVFPPRKRRYDCSYFSLMVSGAGAEGDASDGAGRWRGAGFLLAALSGGGWGRSQTAALF